MCFIVRDKHGCLSKDTVCECDTVSQQCMHALLWTPFSLNCKVYFICVTWTKYFSLNYKTAKQPVGWDLVSCNGVFHFQVLTRFTVEHQVQQFW